MSLKQCLVYFRKGQLRKTCGLPPPILSFCGKLNKLTDFHSGYIIICVNRIKVYPFLKTEEVLSFNPL